MDDPSKSFLDAFSRGVGSPRIECICGRVHVAPDSDFVGQEDSNAWTHLSQSKPERYVAHSGVDGISAFEINGLCVVPDCPCNWLWRFEAMLWNERVRILDYYRRRREETTSSLAALNQQLESLE